MSDADFASQVRSAVQRLYRAGDSLDMVRLSGPKDCSFATLRKDKSWKALTT